MCPVGWKPVTSRIEELIAEEQAKIDAIQSKRQWQVEPLPPKPVTQLAVQEPMDEIIWEQPQYRPPQLTATYTPPQMPTDDEVQAIRTRFQQGTTAIPTLAPITPTTIPAILDTRTQWWEQPAVVGEKVMEAVGQGISKVPVLPKVLKFAEPVFTFIQEKLEKPFAAIITAPFSPSLSWESGESWLEHEKREYETWEAPTYVKGLAEFAMPLWWIPWLGWAGKGAKALGVGNKMARALETLPKAGKLVLPTKQILNDTLYKQDFFKTVTGWAEHKPVLGGIVRAIGGASAFVKAPMIGESAEQIVKREIINRAVIRDMKGSAQSLIMSKLRTYGNPTTVLDIAEDGIVKSATGKVKDVSRYLYDVLENPDAYTFATKEAKGYVNELHNVLNEIRELAISEGVEIPKNVKVHRIVKGVKTLDKEGLEHYEKSEFGSLFEVKRHYNTQLEAVEAGKKTGKVIDYGLNPNESVASTISHYINRIADKRFDDELKKLGVSPLQKITELDPLLVKTLIEQSGKLSSADFALKTVTKLLSYKGKSIPGATISKIRRELPEIADRIDQAFSVAPKDIGLVVSAMGRDILKATKLNPRTFKIMMTQFIKTPDTTLIANQIYKGNYQNALSYFTRAGAGADDVTKFTNLLYKGNYETALAQFEQVAKRIRSLDIEGFVESLNISNTISQRAISNAYKAVYQSRKSFVDETLKTLKDEVSQIIQSTRNELAPLKTKYRKLAEKYTTGKQILGEGEEIMRRRPALRGPVYPREAFPKARPMAGGLIFPKEVVDLVEKATGDAGIKWIRDMGAVSGTSRMLIASLDFSAPFIQGLAVLGRNPLAWIKAVGKQYQFFAHPDSLYKYMAEPINMAVRAERIAFGGSSQSWEFFEAMAPLQKAVGKIPKVGGVGKRVISETYGRAEAAFTGFGEVARNEMWKALRRKSMPEAELRELARSIDRMTGVMSMEALGIGMTQKDFESAFMFFAPRYTRASLSYVSDVLKGGLTGAEARKSLGTLMAGGLAMYYGVSTVLGQTPNLDPRSGSFMTIKVGDSHIGIGGILYGLMRLSSNVATTVAEEPLDLVRLNRFDNPFIRFMFERTAPLTGGIVNVMEQKDYFGQPFESVTDWGKFLAEKVTPIAVQQTWEEQGKTPLVFAVGIVGGRTFPKSAWELREEARDKYAIEILGKPYASIPVIIQRQIDEKPDIKALTEEADKRTIQRGESLSLGFLNRQRDRDDARFMYEQQLWQLQRAVDDGAITSSEFREELQKAGYGLGKTYEFIDTQEKYKEVLAKLKEPKDISDKFIGDVAYSELMTGLYSGQMEDQYGMPLWDKRNSFEESIRQKYGEDVWQYIQAKEADRRKTLPPLAQEYYLSQEVMRPYWAVEDTVVRLFGQRYADSPAGQSLVSKRRKQMRLTNRAIAEAYNKFYKQS